jgi:hypothetical protein
MTRKSPSIYLGLLMACLTLFGIKAIAQEPLNWPQARTYDTGEQTSVAIARNGLYFVEFHRSENTSKMWYKVGRLVQLRPSGYGVIWGKSHDMDVKVEWPSVTVTKEGYVIIAYSPYGQVVNQIMYSVGKININISGGEDQDIQWFVKQQAFGYGFHPSLAVNASGKIAIVYECRNGCTGDLDYRIGHLDDPAAGKFSIVWDTGKDGIHYDRGINPHIAINDSGQAIEVHQVAAKQYYLHYRRGALNATNIDFQPSVRYDNEGKEPAVALTNNGKIIELHAHGYNTDMFSRTGNLNANDPSRVDWSNSVDINYLRFNIYPAVTTNNIGVLATWTAGTNPFGSPGTLQYSQTPAN